MQTPALKDRNKPNENDVAILATFSLCGSLLLGLKKDSEMFNKPISKLSARHNHAQDIAL